MPTALLGYAQSWALFRMLMEERPKQMRAYLTLIWDRRTSEHRLTDFGIFAVEVGLMTEDTMPVKRPRLIVPRPVGFFRVSKDNAGVSEDLIRG